MTETKKEYSGPVWLVIFETTIDGKLARIEVPTRFDPMNSRQVRRDCELYARLEFNKLDSRFHMSDPIKCVECIKIEPPEMEVKPAENGAPKIL